MTRRRKLAIAGIAALALAAGIGVAVALRPASLEERLEQVRIGMTYAEVVEIMGEPHPYTGQSSRDWLYVRCWWSRRAGAAWVHFDGDWRAERFHFVRAEPTGFFDGVLAWFGL